MTEKTNQQPIYLSPELFASQQQNNNDEIDLKELLVSIWKGKLIIIVFTLLFTVGAVFFALNQPNYYKAQVLLAPASGSSGGGALGNLGGLAALAGVNIGGAKDDKTQLALAVLKSRDFQTRFINTHKVKIPLFAGIGWDESSDEIIIDPQVYNVATGEWVREVELGKNSSPSDWEAFEAFSQVITTSQEKESGFITISVEFLSPTTSKQWLELLVQELNKVMKRRELVETQRNIDYLEEQLNNTSIADMQNVFYQLIEEQLKNKMLAEVQDEYVFKVIDPPVVPEEKSKPKRALISIVGCILGGIIGISFIVIRFLFQRER